MSKQARDNNDSLINKEFEKQESLSLSEFESVTVKVCKLPKIFQKILFQAVVDAEKLGDKAEKVTKKAFSSFFRSNLEGLSEARRVFNLISSDPQKKFISPDDFKPLFKYLLVSHPGLEFLQATPEF